MELRYILQRSPEGREFGRKAVWTAAGSKQYGRQYGKQYVLQLGQDLRNNNAVISAIGTQNKPAHI